MKRLFAGGLAALLFFVCLFLSVHNPDKVAATQLPPRPAMEQYKTDELQLLTAACGKPTSDKLSDAAAYGGANAVKRTVVYSRKNMEFWFLKNSVDAPAWTFIGAFNGHGDDSSRSPEEFHKRMPCTEKVTFHLAD